MEFATGLNSFTAVFIAFSYSNNKSFFSKRYAIFKKKEEGCMVIFALLLGMLFAEFT